MTAPRAGWLPWAALGSLAAALLLWFYPGTPTPMLVLESGHQRVEGQATVLAAGLPVVVDGVATIRVEPVREAAREGGAEVEMKLDGSHAVALAAGVLVTVSVYEGRAVFAGEELVAGQERSLAAEEPVELGEPDALASVEPVEQRAERAERELDEALERVEALESELALRDERLKEAVGSPQTWGGAGVPTMPPALGPERFEQTLLAALEPYEQLELLDLDCAESPCVAVLLSHADGEGWERDVGALGGDLSDAVGEDLGQMIMASEREDDLGVERIVGLALLPGEEHPGSEFMARTQGRTQELVEANSEVQ